MLYLWCSDSIVHALQMNAAHMYIQDMQRSIDPTKHQGAMGKANALLDTCKGRQSISQAGKLHRLPAPHMHQAWPNR